MFPPRKILIIDHNFDCGERIAQMLRVNFPQCALELVRDFSSASERLTGRLVDAVVVRETREFDPISLTKAIRQIDGGVPLMAVAAVDRADEALEAGATVVLSYDNCIPRDNSAGARRRRPALARKVVSDRR